MMQRPRKNPDRHQNLINSFPSHAPPLHKILSKSVRNFFFRYFANTQTDSHRIWRIHNFLGGGNQI